MEIQLDIPFTPSEISMLDMHSVLNVLTVLQYEFVRLEAICADSSGLEKLADEIADAGASLSDPAKARSLLENLDAFEASCREQLERVGAQPLEEEGRALHRAACANVQGIFQIIQVRARELRQRREAPAQWVAHDVGTLRNNFQTVFQAIERNSRGAYRIVYNLAQHEEGDYLIHLDISGDSEGRLWMPPVFQDVMRDLIANARKYTPPGGAIQAGVTIHNGLLRFVVSDTGCGIPPDELAHVAKFGYRAGNVLNRPTCGGGFGLTKAYYVTKLFDGRMWVDSPVADGKGTRIEIRIPVPAQNAGSRAA